MAQYCLEMPYGGLRHFPAGTYYAQVEHQSGRQELQLMSIAHSVWYMFKKLSLSQWDESQRRLAKYMMDEPPAPKSSERLDAIIAALWDISLWSRIVMRQLRDDA